MKGGCRRVPDRRERAQGFRGEAQAARM